ncbi:MAG: hypothetical protein LBK43_05945, partial [Treponema sp.]|nr:hypothetical protein [Treponema sp.]
RVYVCDEYGGTFGEKLYWEMFNSSRAGYAELSDSDRLGEKAAWIIVQEDMDGNRYTDIDVAPLYEFRGLFGWGWYKFRLYYIDSATKLAVYNR